jgi:hypothetical protein
MTKTLEQVIERLRQMPEDRQDQLARLMLQAIEDDERWEKSTDAHAGKLRGFVDDMLSADARGECEPLDPDQL